MHWSSPWFIILLATGLIFVIAGALMYFRPPRKINLIYGYRSKLSMRNQGNWDFAQRFSSVQMIRLGWALMAISCLGWIIPMDETLASILPLILIIAGVVLFIWRTEQAIKKHEATRQ